MIKKNCSSYYLTFAYSIIVVLILQKSNLGQTNNLHTGLTENQARIVDLQVYASLRLKSEEMTKKIQPLLGFSTSEIKKRFGQPTTIVAGFPEVSIDMNLNNAEQLGRLVSSTWFYNKKPIKVYYSIPTDTLYIIYNANDNNSNPKSTRVSSKKFYESPDYSYKYFINNEETSETKYKQSDEIFLKYYVNGIEVDKEGYDVLYNRDTVYTYINHNNVRDITFVPIYRPRTDLAKTHINLELIDESTTRIDTFYNAKRIDSVKVDKQKEILEFSDEKYVEVIPVLCIFFDSGTQVATGHSVYFIY